MNAHSPEWMSTLEEEYTRFDTDGLRIPAVTIEPMFSIVNRLLEPHRSRVEQRFSVILVAQIGKGCAARRSLSIAAAVQLSYRIACLHVIGGFAA